MLQSVTINCTPQPGYEFVSWTNKGIVVATTPQYTFKMPTENTTLVANLRTVAKHRLTLTANYPQAATLTGQGDYYPGEQVQVTCTPGHLTDHYDPRTKTVNLSEGVYDSANVAAAAVAAHECGHALQHAVEYAPLQMRSSLVPVVNFASRWVTWILLGGILMIETFPQLMVAGIVLYALTTLFSFITLPVEINASTRAVAWLEQAGITDRQTTPMAATALRSAAYTYVVSALASLGTLVYYIWMFMGRRN
jgi:Zn-dependent membrane protease YugP